jgi:putative ABC transport system substrate-binding protein
MIFPADRVEVGLVAGLSRPGGNVTGTTPALGAEIPGERLQLPKEAVPRAFRVAVLRNPADPSGRYTREVETAARSPRIRLQVAEARGPEEFDRAFADMARERTDALLLAGTATFLSHSARLAELATRARLPAMSNFREFVEAGGLMAFPANMADCVGRAAAYADKIPRGARPADPPARQPAKFEPIINLKTARVLGISPPQSPLQRADDVIQ